MSNPTSTRVPRYGRFERLLENPVSYADPFTDVRLAARWIAPDGAVTDFDGFHVGGSAWKLRFMPHLAGEWRYEARFSDGAGESSGTFSCVPSDLPGVVTPHAPNPTWFGFSSGRPFFMRSFHVGDRFFADVPNTVTGAPMDPARRSAFLDWVQNQGYNTLSVASCLLNRDSDDRGHGWTTPDLWDAEKGRPNTHEWDRFESILDDLSERRIVLYPFAGFFGRDADFPSDPDRQAAFIRYAVSRLAPCWNVMFNVSGPEPMLRNRPFLDAADIRRLGRLIAAHDPFGHAISVHNPTGDDPFRDAEWTDYGILQGPKTLDRNQVLYPGLMRNHHPRKPLFAQETLWPGNIHGHPPYTDDDIRKHTIVIHMAGATLNFADHEGNSSSGFSGSLDPADGIPSRHAIVKRAWDILESLPWHRLRPTPECANAGFCQSAPGFAYLVYLERGRPVTVQTEGGPFTGTWINPRTADRLGAQISSTGAYDPPDDNDWFLYLSRP